MEKDLKPFRQQSPPTEQALLSKCNLGCRRCNRHRRRGVIWRAECALCSLQVSYDKQGLNLLNISNGKVLSEGEQVVALVHREDPSNGAVEITASRPPGAEGLSGHGVVTTLTFQAKTTAPLPIKIPNPTRLPLLHHPPALP